MANLVSIVNEAIRRLTVSPKVTALTSDQAVCSANSNQTRCDCTMLGAFHKALAADGWANRDMRCSPAMLYKRIKKIAVHACQLAERPAAHNLCDPFGGGFVTLESIVAAAINDIPFNKASLTERAMALGFERMGD